MSINRLANTVRGVVFERCLTLVFISAVLVVPAAAEAQESNCVEEAGYACEYEIEQTVFLTRRLLLE